MFLFLTGAMMAWLAVELDKFCGVENNNSAQGERSYHVMYTPEDVVKHPRGSYIVTPLLFLEVATPESESIHSTMSSICKKVRLKSGS